MEEIAGWMVGNSVGKKNPPLEWVDRKNLSQTRFFVFSFRKISVSISGEKFKSVWQRIQETSWHRRCWKQGRGWGLPICSKNSLRVFFNQAEFYTPLCWGNGDESHPSSGGRVTFQGLLNSPWGRRWIILPTCLKQGTDDWIVKALLRVY